MPDLAQRAHTATARASYTITLVFLTTTAFLTTTRERALTRAGGRRSDRGDVLQYVIIAAGVVGMSIAVIAWVRPVVMRYLQQIN